MKLIGLLSLTVPSRKWNLSVESLSRLNPVAILTIVGTGTSRLATRSRTVT